MILADISSHVRIGLSRKHPSYAGERDKSCGSLQVIDLVLSFVCKLFPKLYRSPLYLYIWRVIYRLHMVNVIITIIMIIKRF
jgi:hypothetical protein